MLHHIHALGMHMPALQCQGTEFEVVDTGDCLCLDSDCTACVPPPKPQITVLIAGQPVVGPNGVQADTSYAQVG